MTVMRDETFGPVVPVVEVGSLDEAIEQANSVPYGLGANVYTQDFEKMLKCMRELRAGTVWINDPLTDNDAAPFGGQRGSGIGRELGREGLEAFQESKARPHRSQGREEGVVVPLRQGRRSWPEDNVAWPHLKNWRLASTGWTLSASRTS